MRYFDYISNMTMTQQLVADFGSRLVSALS